MSLTCQYIQRDLEKNIEESGRMGSRVVQDSCGGDSVDIQTVPHRRLYGGV